MKQFLLITAAILGVCAAGAVGTAIVMSSRGNVNASIVFAAGFCCVIVASLCVIAHGWWYSDSSFWEQDTV